MDGELRPEVVRTFAFLLGLLVGSFLNVVIHRLPRGESVVHPRSSCPSCGQLIAAWHNIPVLSWLWLRGRCADCRAPISARYPAIELLTGVLFAVIVWRGVLAAMRARDSFGAYLAFGVVLAMALHAAYDYVILAHGWTFAASGITLVVWAFVIWHARAVVKGAAVPDDSRDDLPSTPASPD